MAESSIFWTTGATGDGASPYTMAQVTAWLRRTLTPGQANGGVIKVYGNELAVSGTSSPVTVATGAAQVYGYPYENDSAATVAIPTPSGATRVDRIVLRASWSAQTVRITRIAGTEGGGAPSLTQTPGTTYDIPLAQVSITTGGVITVTDERVFCAFGTVLQTANLADSVVTAAKIADGAISTAKLASGVLSADTTGRAKMADGYITTAKIGNEQVTAAKIANRERRFLVPAVFAKNETDGTHLDWGGADDPGWNTPDSKQSAVAGSFLVPKDYVSGMYVYAVVHPQASGNLYCDNLFRSAKAGETQPQHAHSTGYQAVSVTNDVVTEIQVIDPSTQLQYVEPDEYVALRWTRNAVSASDTVNNTCKFLGWMVYYTADS
jgi:hypothetical protein